MITIFKILFIPSSFIFFLIALGILLFILNKTKLAKRLACVGLCFYYLLSITPISDGLIYYLEKDYSPPSLKEIEKADQIVVLSGGKNADVLRRVEALRLSHLTNHSLDIIIAGTEELNPKKQISEVEKFFVSRGVPKENIIIEDQSRSTRENIENIKKEVANKEFLMVTSGYHMKRAMKEAQRQDVQASPAPADVKFQGEYSWKDFLPNSQNLRKSDLAVYEYLALTYYMTFD